jgi:uncharacterized protein (TIGR01244 family)
MFIRLTPAIAVSAQITPEDCARAAEEGFVAVVNNRPDGESPGQPDAVTMKAAAEAVGLRYADIPVDHSGMSMQQVEAMAAELAAAGGKPLLAFCRSGTRSAHLWALAAALGGQDPDAIVAAAGNGGYDVGGLLPTMHRLAKG